MSGNWFSCFKTLSATPSSIKTPESQRSIFQPPRVVRRNGYSRCKTMELELTRNTLKEFLAFFSGCTNVKSSPAPASDWRSARKSSSATAAASRSSQNPGRDPPFALPWREVKGHHRLHQRKRHAHESTFSRRQPR